MKPLKYEEGYELYELVLSDEEDGTFALSLVSEPAIAQHFVYFSKDGKIEVQFATTDNTQRTILGPILIPDIKILRLTDSGEPYFVTFSKDTVKEIAQKYIKDNNSNNVTIEHKKPTNAVSLVESWVVDSPIYDKSKKYGLAIKPGTWMGVFKVHETPEGDKIWNEYVKTKKLRGISLEGLFTHNLIKASKVDWMEKSLEHLSDEESELLLSQIRALIKEDNRYKSKQRIEMESYSDYGESVRANAKRGRELNEKNGNKCATQVGKIRSAQLEEGAPISLETIKRMYSYLSRAETYYDNADSTSDCGYISYLLWGGKSALSWSRNKLRELGELVEGAEVGPRGGIKESPKAPKSDTPNPEPKGEGSAEGKASGKRGAKVSAEDEKTLEGKVKDFNDRESNTKYGKATLGVLKSVFQRGLGAFNVSHSPKVQSASQWAFARVNAFLYLLKNGRPENPKYTSDFDLLPKGHPKASENMESQPSISSSYPGQGPNKKKKKGYTHRALLQEDCPPATQNIEINLQNRQIAIEKAMYGPLDIKNPGDYWKKIAQKWEVDEETARGEVCGNCAAFNITSNMLKCISEGIGGNDTWDVIEAGDLGYCEFFKFKCNANRSCLAHVDGGPITD